MTTTDRTDEFYPENAQEVNFANAAELAAANHEKDLLTRSIGSTEPSRVEETTATEVINPVADPLGASTDTETEKDA